MHGKDSYITAAANTLYTKFGNRGGYQSSAYGGSSAHTSTGANYHRGQAVPYARGGQNYSEGNRSSGYVPRRFFCKAYQKDKCTAQGSHEGDINGVPRLVEHFCATCQKDRGIIAHHPESSKDCPGPRVA